jgi:hypothetical protein
MAEGSSLRPRPLILPSPESVLMLKSILNLGNVESRSGWREEKCKLFKPTTFGR